MKNKMLIALARILLEGQAFLYADLMRLRVESKDEPVTEEMFDRWRDDWMLETKAQLDAAVAEDNEDE